MGTAHAMAGLGRWVADQVADLGRFGIFCTHVLRWLFTSVPRWRLLGPQFYHIGVQSLPVVVITGAFVGMVLAVQSYYHFESIGRAAWSGSVINLSVLKELGPVLAGIMLAGRVGGALAAELGTMKITEQIDAMRSLGADPIRHLVVPRFLATFLLIPFLTVYCDFVGILGGYLIAAGYGVDSHEYWLKSAQAIENWDIFAGVLKAVCFGASIALISCYKGFQSRQGAEGVGRAATEAFVASFMVILLLDLAIVMLLQSIYRILWGMPVLFV